MKIAVSLDYQRKSYTVSLLLAINKTLLFEQKYT